MNLKQHLSLVPALLVLCCALPAHASGTAEKVHEYKSVIALKSDDFELVETDISDLAVGESETIITDSGKTIDLLRTEDGVEVYVDGELLDTGNGLHAEQDSEHAGLHKEIEITCDAEHDCEKMVWVSDDGASGGEDGEMHVIKREIVIECDDEQDCADHQVWISEDDESGMSFEDAEANLHVIRLHEETGEAHGGTGEKVIVIKKKIHQD